MKFTPVQRASIFRGLKQDLSNALALCRPAQKWISPPEVNCTQKMGEVSQGLHVLIKPMSITLPLILSYWRAVVADSQMVMTPWSWLSSPSGSWSSRGPSLTSATGVRSWMDHWLYVSGWPRALELCFALLLSPLEHICHDLSFLLCQGQGGWLA